MKLNDYNKSAERVGGAPQYRGAVVTVHGMYTHGPWQKNITPILQDAAVRHRPVDYGFTVCRALWPRTRDDVAGKIIDAVQEQRQVVPNLRPGIIAHSFGTLCLGWALEGNPSLKVERICLFGTILRRRFPWPQLEKHEQYEAVLNETCHKDPWPKIARYVFCNAGESGCYGFLDKGTFVHDCPYDSTGHSNLGSALHCQETWLPFILDGRLPPHILVC